LVHTPDGRYVIDVARFRGEDLLSDLSDRDFTVNAMAVDLTGSIDQLIDPLNGEADAKAKILRRCSDHALFDDPVRVLRAVRQSVQFDMRIEPQTVHDIKAARPYLQRVSAERTRDEFIKLLALTQPRKALRVLDALGILADIVPETGSLRSLTPHSADYADGWQETLSVIEKVSQLVTAISPRRTEDTGASFGLGMVVMQLDRYRQRLREHIEQVWPNDRSHSALLVLSVLLHGASGEAAAARAQALRLSNAERDRLMLLVRFAKLPLELEDVAPLTVHHFWRRTGTAGVDVCLLAGAYSLAQYGSEVDQNAWLIVIERLLALLDAYYEHYDELVEPPILLDGNQLMSRLEIEPGPVVGLLLDRIREAQVLGTVHSADEALQLARSVLAETPHN
ncbi:MAG: hypothetical protein K8J31_11190, partial [Anaerolineae bacterium]|nr:hypothetical protein [Anaerolineae bacterium]